MREAPRAGLLAAGPMSPSIFRFQGLSQSLGPVAAESLRVASRLANRLRAGTAVPLEELARVRLLLVTGPADRLPDLVSAAFETGFSWTGKGVVFLDASPDRHTADRLRARGAWVTTLHEIPFLDEPSFAADPPASAQPLLRKWAVQTGIALTLLDEGALPLFLAGETFSLHRLLPLVEASASCFQAAGLPATTAYAFAEKATAHTVRTSARLRKRGGRQELEPLCQHSRADQLAALRTARPELVEAFSGSDAEPRTAAAGRLAANLAHDWNNHLALLGAQVAELAHLAGNAPAVRSLVGEMEQTLTLAADAPRRLLDWLRARPGTWTNATLHDAIDPVLPLVRLTLGRGVALRPHLEAPLPPQRLDIALLRHALLNLAANATQAMGGKGHLRIETAIEDGAAVLRVTDNGPGVSEQVRQRMLEPFFTTRAENGGTGLGLATVRAFAEAHGASLSISAAPGKGCSFAFRFPAN